MYGWIPRKPSPTDVPSTPEWHPPTEAAGYGPTVSAPLAPGQADLTAQQVTRTGRPADLVRYGRGVPGSAASSQARPTAGQHAVYVSVTVNGQGHGSISQLVTLRVLGPALKTAAARVVLGCP